MSRHHQRKKEDRGVSLDEMPVLFDMEMFCAGLGALLTVVWLVYFYYRGQAPSSPASFFRDPLLVVGVLAFILFFVTLTVLYPKGTKAALVDQEQGVARLYLIACSGFCVLGMVLLVWISGGAISPFILLFVMTHTLTVASVKNRMGPWIVAFAFGIGMLIAITLHEAFPLADNAVVEGLVGGSVAWLTTSAGALLSVVVSTNAALRNAQRLKIEEDWKGISTTPGYQPHKSVLIRAKVMKAVLAVADLLAQKRRSCLIVIGSTDVPFKARIGDKSIEPQVTLKFASYRVFCKWQRGMRLGVLARYYLSGKVSVEGDFLKLARLVDAFPSKPATRFESAVSTAVRKVVLVLRRGGKSLGHYGESPRFFELFLDQHLQYTCGLFQGEPSLEPPRSAEAAKTELDAAQIAKLQLIDKWLDLAPGQSLLDVGCGWGGLCSYFATEKRVNAWGITNSKAQAEFARTFIRERGGDATRIVRESFSHYKPTDTFDCITVVGMLEHVPEEHRDAFFEKAYSILKPGGRLYLQCITRADGWTGGDGSRFLNEFVFPGFALEDFDRVRSRAEKVGFRVRDVKQDNKHYGRTMLLWLTRVVANADGIRAESGDRVYRMMTAYLSLASLVYHDGRGALHRALLQKPS